MAKQKDLLDFYRPDADRESTKYTGELLNHITGEVYKPPSMTQQSFVAECDINNILAEYKTSGQIRHMSAKADQGTYQDLPGGIDFQEALNTVIAGENAFATLPSQVRARFGNDPAEFLMFMADPANQDEAIRMGLATDNRPPPETKPEATSTTKVDQVDQKTGDK